MLMELRRFPLICTWLILLAPQAFAADSTTTQSTRPAVVIGIDPSVIKKLAGVFGDAGLNLRASDGATDLPSDAVVLLQPGHDIPQAMATALGEHVRRGGSLLLVLSNTSSIAPNRLAFMLPTTAWRIYNDRGFGGPISATEFDADFFGSDAKIGKLPLAYHIDIQPVDAVERGQARYERFARIVQSTEWIKQAQKPGDTFWTRSLINREWTTRVRGDNQAGDGLLVTGRYGAGRVAVFGAGADQLDAWAGDSSAAVRKIVDWLTVSTMPVPTSSVSLKVTHQIDYAARQIKVSVTNTSDVAADTQVIARLLTWEGTFDTDVSKPLSIPAGATADVTLDIPPITATSFQALDHADVWDVRLGVLTDGGADVTGESRFPIDLGANPRVSVSLDDLYAQPYPFDGPKPETMPHFQARLGSGTTRYTYKPGETVHVTVRVANGVSNIAPQSQVKDLVNAGNMSVSALTDGNTKSELTPTHTIEAFGMWNGADKQDNAIEFTWPEPRTISSVTLVGSADDLHKHLRKNPGSAIVEIDGNEVARAEELDKRFPAEMGRVRISFAPTKGSKLTLKIPWTPAAPRSAPSLTEVEIDGSAADEKTSPDAVHGMADVKLVDAETNAVVATKQAAVEVGSDDVASTAVDMAVPDQIAGQPHAFRIEATFAGHSSAAPLLVTNPAHPLHDITELNPQGTMSFGFIVTRGFRTFFDIGTGTQEMPDPWQSPDDLIWCYEHLLKQESDQATTKANRLYVSSDDFRHYSSPWRTFPNGQSVMELGAANLYAAVQRPDWPATTVVRYEFSDRWDTGPTVDALHSWQDYTEFDRYLRHTTGKGLQGRTRPELAKEIKEHFSAQWMAYQKAAYLKALHDLASPFEAAGKKVYLSAQGVPLVSGPDADVVYKMVRGMSDDSTWGMDNEDVPLTTGRQMGMLAFNPSAAMSTLFMWGWDSAILDNPYWRVPVGTTEPSRRNQYDQAWRGTIDWDGSYKSIHTYGYNANGGTSYQMHGNDWQEMWRAAERLALIRPEAPLGAGVIISTAKLNQPGSVSFSGNGSDPQTTAGALLARVPNVVRRLQEAGVSVPFAANVSALKNWKGDTPLILLNLHEFSDDEIAILKSLRDRGVKLVALVGPQDQPTLSPSARELIHAPDNWSGGKGTETITATDGTIACPVDAHDLTAAQAADLQSAMTRVGDVPITYPPGAGGYGFVSSGMKFIVVEDWREQPRTLELRVRAATGAQRATAVELNDHLSLPVKRDGADWVIELNTRPGDGNLMMLREESL
jgi:hypothetical protein